MHATGGPDVLRVESIRVPDPGAREIRIEQKAIGVNFIDIYQRRGLYPVAALPAIVGFEAAGIVESVGGAVSTFKEGDRIAYATAPPGAYTGLRNIDARAVVALPDALSFEQAAAVMLKGMTAEYLVHKSYPVQPGDIVLVHAAAGGTGRLLCQWLAHIGAMVIGTVGHDDKRATAEAHGCRHVINYRTDNVAAAVEDVAGGDSVPVVYDSVGRETAETSLACLRSGGTFVLYGQSSGAVGPALLADAKARSIAVKQPGLFDENNTEDALQAGANALFDVLQSGALTADVTRRFSLAEAADAHGAVEARTTTGSTVLVP
jgi:NADPH2:quinone reductase